MKPGHIIFNRSLIEKYDKSGPRYTSYPTAVQFTENFTKSDYTEIAKSTNEEKKPLSLYVHVPFCDTICFYCGCNKIATKDRSKSMPYIELLDQEMLLQSRLFDNDRAVDQLHLGGGTPTFLGNSEIKALMAKIQSHFKLHLDDSGEYSIEIDPRETDSLTISVLRDSGFNRMSLGVQDFDQKVQKAINRIQSVEQTYEVMNTARRVGFKAVSIDLIYGLPHQSVGSFSVTLHKILELQPDRISVFNYAHLPNMFKPQRRIHGVDLPDANTKLAIFISVMQILNDAGYVYVGMDHFALPDDELSKAQQSGSLYRNFQGYSTHKNCDLIGLGVSSISMVGDCYAQNYKTLEEYQKNIEARELAIFRGIELNRDDTIRREVITELICNFKLFFSDINDKYNINFNDYFQTELAELTDMKNDGLLDICDDKIVVHDSGRLLIRNVCMVFDYYLKKLRQEKFSKLI